jgi:hypothetical protein
VEFRQFSQQMNQRRAFPSVQAVEEPLIIAVGDLARATVNVAIRDKRKPGGPILENHDIRSMVE